MPEDVRRVEVITSVQRRRRWSVAEKGPLSAREYLAIRLAEQMAGDPNYISDQFYDELKAEFSEEEIVELVFACSVFNFGNKFNITMRLDAAPDSKYPKGMTYPLAEAKVAAE
jgi:alkylhydroperoxidase family enzyme